ncbi:MAG: winged helix-turn-helix domain-containing protein [Nitrososphaerales archaeon]
MKSALPYRKKRQKEEIVASILDAARAGATKTRIMYVSFSSFSQLERYLDMALEKGLLGLDPVTKKYLVTSRGLEYLKHFEDVRNIENNVVEKRKLLSQFLDGKG